MTITTHDIIAAFVDAGQAIENNKTLNVQVDELCDKLEASERHAQELELKLHNRSTFIDELETKVRSLEVERDDYAFRHLETVESLNAERDKINQVLGMLRSSVNPSPVVETPPATTPTTTDTPTQGKYAGKKYSEVGFDSSLYSSIGYPSKDEWLAAGGAIADYWR